MKNLEYSIYTYKHRKAIFYLIDKLITDNSEKKEILKRCQDHDMDKMYMYTYMDKKDASKKHRESIPHHLDNNIEKDYYDKLEAILDFESAAYTKPDKPLNAYDTLKKYYKDYLNDKDIINILNKYNLNSSYTVLDDKEGINYLKKYDNIKEEDIIKEINDYLKRINKEDEIK